MGKYYLSVANDKSVPNLKGAIHLARKGHSLGSRIGCVLCISAQV